MLSSRKWFPYIMGGDYRKWYGNREYVVNWLADGNEIRTKRHPTEDRIWATNFNLEFIFRPNVNWNSITSAKLSFRLSPGGELFASTGLACFSEANDKLVASFLNSPVASYFLSVVAPTMSANPGDIGRLPFLEIGDCEVVRVAQTCESISRADWDSCETSWDFTSLPLFIPSYRQQTLKATYQKLRKHWREMTLDMQRLEEENNRIFIEAYGLQDELTPDVPLDEITLTRNPHYQYGNNKSEDELEALLLADTMRELASYAVGCMFGRYALEEPGLILANQGETISDYLKQIPEPSFPADDDNVIPMLDGDWFTDDITERFREFLRIAFREEHYGENLRFVEQALGKDIRKYFLKDFYNDHVRRYKKRPIYWLFSSPKGSFNALIYMHRYQPHTVGTVLEYLRDFKDEKLQARKNHLEAVSISAGASQGEKTKALKEIEKINKILAELDDYERDVLYPLATEQVEIDLDDGVKANYPKFGDALKKITGLSG